MLDAHETALRVEWLATGLVVATVDQLVPFHSSESVSVSVPVVLDPTPIQKVTDTKDTLWRGLLSSRAGGLMVDQLEPFHSSTSDSLFPLLSSYDPTPTQNVADTQEMDPRAACRPGSGWLTLDQVAEPVA